MPKSLTTIKDQLTTCERNMQTCLEQLSAVVIMITVNFSLRRFVDTIDSCDIDESIKNCRKTQEVFEECQNLLSLEIKRRKYSDELLQSTEKSDRRARFKRLRLENSFIKKSV